MSSKELELALMNISLILVAILVSILIIRGIRILATRKIYTKDDLLIVLFLGFLVTIGMYWFYKIKRCFKKSK